MKVAEFLPAQSLSETADMVKLLREIWIKRSVFYTLGAAAYLDKGLRYEVAYTMYNPIIIKFFSHLLKELDNHFDGIKHNNDVALPGFHIFDHHSNGVKGSVHVDIEHKRLWQEEAEAHYSFTVPLELPKAGAGLTVWKDGKEVFHPYEIGNIYTHSGADDHQITMCGDMGEEEYRITFQGHCATINGQNLIYF